MAGGMGKRMNSNIPKVLHKIQNIPMICYLLKTVLLINPTKIFIVVGKYKDIIEQTINEYIDNNNIITYINQQNALGTGDAILCTLYELKNYENSKVLILSGDTPLISNITMKNMLNSPNCYAMVTKYEDGDDKFKDYGKVICKNDIINKIVEK